MLQHVLVMELGYLIWGQRWDELRALPATLKCYCKMLILEIRQLFSSIFRAGGRVPTPTPVTGKLIFMYSLNLSMSIFNCFIILQKQSDYRGEG